MRHRLTGKKLGRNFNERKALLRSLTRSIFTYGSIKTTQAKVKAVIPEVEKLSNIIMSKDELIAKRELFRVLQDQHWVNRVFTQMKSVFGDQKSNFTKTQKIKYRQGDDALIVKLSFIKEINFQPEKKEKPKKGKNKKEVKKTEKNKKPKITKTSKKETK